MKGFQGRLERTDRGSMMDRNKQSTQNLLLVSGYMCHHYFWRIYIAVPESRAQVLNGGVSVGEGVHDSVPYRHLQESCAHTWTPNCSHRKWAFYDMSTWGLHYRECIHMSPPPPTPQVLVEQQHPHVTPQVLVEQKHHHITPSSSGTTSPHSPPCSSGTTSPHNPKF